MIQTDLRSLFVVVLVAGVMLMLAPAAADAQAQTFTDVFRVDNAGMLFNHLCDESVTCTGYTNVVIHGRTNEQGTLLRIHQNDQGVDCWGQESGLTYHSTFAVNQTLVNFPDCAEGCAATIAGHWDLQAPGPGNDLRDHFNLHVTFNNNGVLTAVVERTDLTCTD